MTITKKELEEVVGVNAESDVVFVCSHCGTRQSLFPVELRWDSRVVARLLGTNDERLRKLAVKQKWERHFRISGRRRQLIRQYTAAEIRFFANVIRTKRPWESVPMKTRHEHAEARKARKLQYKLAGHRSWDER